MYGFLKFLYFYYLFLSYLHCVREYSLQNTDSLKCVDLCFVAYYMLSFLRLCVAQGGVLIKPSLTFIFFNELLAFIIVRYECKQLMTTINVSVCSHTFLYLTIIWDISFKLKNIQASTYHLHCISKWHLKLPKRVLTFHLNDSSNYPLLKPKNPAITDFSFSLISHSIAPITYNSKIFSNLFTFF